MPQLSLKRKCFLQTKNPALKTGFHVNPKLLVLIQQLVEGLELHP